MSTRVVLIWLAVAVILGGIAVFLLQSKSATRSAAAGQIVASGERILQFLPGDVQRIEFKAPDRSREVIRRDDANAATPWLIAIERSVVVGSASVPTSAQPVEWAVVETRVQAFLQKLLDTRAVSTPEKGTTLSGATPTIIKLSLKDGRIIQINVSDRTLGGTGLIEIIDSPSAPSSAPSAARLALIDDWLHQVSRTPGPRAWRETTALMLARTDVSRVSLSSAAGATIALGRVGGRWTLREPVAAPADPKAVTSLLSKLASVEIRNFLDEGPGSADTRLDTPVAIAQLEYDRRVVGQEAPTTTIRNSLAVGAAGALSAGAAAAADRVYAKIDSERVVLVDGRVLAELAMEPGAYIWPHPTTTPVADIGTIILEVRGPGGASVDSTPDGAATQRVLRKELDRWAAVNTDGSLSAMVEQSQRDVQSLLMFLTGAGAEAERGAAAVGVVAPTRFNQFARLTLLTLGSGELETIDIAEVGSGLVTFKTGSVYRTYTQDRLPALLAQLRALAKAAGVDIEGADAPIADPSGDSMK